jgi:hypothetical protein
MMFLHMLECCELPLHTTVFCALRTVAFKIEKLPAEFKDFLDDPLRPITWHLWHLWITGW